jgi:hypothetical protein
MMTQTDFFNQLQQLSLNELDKIYNDVLTLAKQKKEKLLNQEKINIFALPKVQTSGQKAADLADQLNLDITGLMREISKK